MTTLSRSLSAIRNQSPSLTITGNSLSGLGGGMAASYQSIVRSGYQGNDIVHKALDLRADSASEPPIIGRRYKNVNQRRQAKTARAQLAMSGMPLWAQKEILNRQRIEEEVGEEHPLVRLLNNPNPLNSRFQFYSTIIMDRDLAGNAYIYKARGFLGNTMELWRLRPDRVKVLTDSKGHLTGYSYTVDRETVTFPKEDVIHWKTKNPLDDHYGAPPLMAAFGRISIDNYMTEFVGRFFDQGTHPGGILTTKNKLSQESKDQIQKYIESRYSGRQGWFKTMLLTENEATYQQMQMALGAQGLAMPELSDRTEARVAMSLGIPPSILNMFVGLEKSSYANQRQDWQILWDVTFAPMYSDLDDQLNLDLTLEFGGVDEVLFDLAQVKALQEDVDKLHERARKNVAAGMWPVEYGALITGIDLSTAEGTLLIPSNTTPVPIGQLGDPLPAPVPQLPPPAPTALLEAVRIVDKAACPDCGKFMGENVNEGARLWCKACKVVKVVAG